MYALPYRNDRYVLVYNCDLFDQAGIEYPNGQITWDDFFSIAEQLQPALEDDQYACMTLPMDVQWMASGRMLSQENDAESMHPIMNWMLNMQDKGLTPSYSDCIAQDIQQQCFELGDYAMYIGGSWYLNYLASDQKKELFSFSWGVTAAPYWEEDEGYAATSILTGIGITKQSDNKELAYSFLDFITGEQGAVIMAGEQMIPAYTNDIIQEVYRESFSGKVLDDSVYKTESSGLKRDTESRVQEVLCDGWRKAVTRQEKVDQVIEDMKREIENM
ncbi:MAG: extracellular solute-binding protein [Lachnospiraceae bacterium]|nr:extracellular solute-binding protein [Lachnospiraceae bacterium]